MLLAVAAAGCGWRRRWGWEGIYIRVGGTSAASVLSHRFCSVCSYSGLFTMDANMTSSRAALLAEADFMATRL